MPLDWVGADRRTALRRAPGGARPEDRPSRPEAVEPDAGRRPPCRQGAAQGPRLRHRQDPRGRAKTEVDGPTMCIPAPASSWARPPGRAPSRRSGEEVDGRSDLYSVGVILYELLTGYRPFSGPLVRHDLRPSAHAAAPVRQDQPEPVSSPRPSSRSCSAAWPRIPPTAPRRPAISPPSFSGPSTDGKGHLGIALHHRRLPLPEPIPRGPSPTSRCPPRRRAGRPAAVHPRCSGDRPQARPSRQIAVRPSRRPNLARRRLAETPRREAATDPPRSAIEATPARSDPAAANRPGGACPRDGPALRWASGSSPAASRQFRPPATAAEDFQPAADGLARLPGPEARTRRGSS